MVAGHCSGGAMMGLGAVPQQERGRVLAFSPGTLAQTQVCLDSSSLLVHLVQPGFGEGQLCLINC